MEPGGETTIDGTTLSLRFERVSGDSRCPADAVCILGGDATVHVKAVEDGTITELELHTGDSARASAPVGSRLVTLTGLQPYPFSNRTIDPGEYRATLRVTSVAAPQTRERLFRAGAASLSTVSALPASGGRPS